MDFVWSSFGVYVIYLFVYYDKLNDCLEKIYFFVWVN